MKILSIETSCDETALSILEAEGVFGDENNPPKFKILANNLISQIDLHKKYGGVFPALAKREHSKNLIPLLAKTLTEAKLSNRVTKNKNDIWHSECQMVKEVEKILEREPELLELSLKYLPTIETPNIDALAVTQGPGLEPALWVGINFAQVLSLVWEKPLIPVNHMEGHLLSAFINGQEFIISKLQFPAIALLISGGHTELILMREWMNYEKIGQTLDDAVGEAFDKAARMLNLPYPGGPEISKLAQVSRKNNLHEKIGVKIKLPRPMINTDDFNFSFSGLKTAVLYLIKNLKEKNNWEELPLEIKQIIAQEFEDAVVEVLLKKSQKTLEKFNAHTLILGGGVIANSQIRQAFQTFESDTSKLKVLIPEKNSSTDNALMIGVAGYFRYLEQKNDTPLLKVNTTFKADGNLVL